MVSMGYPSAAVTASACAHAAPAAPEQVRTAGTFYDHLTIFARDMVAHHFGYVPGESLKNYASVMLAAGKGGSTGSPQGQPARRRLRQERRRDNLLTLYYLGQGHGGALLLKLVPHALEPQCFGSSAESLEYLGRR